MSIWTVLSSLLAVILALAIVLGLAWVTIKGLRRWQDRIQPGRDEAGKPIRFLRAMPLGQNERLVLVEVSDETILVGVTPGGISLLKTWPTGAASQRAIEDEHLD